MSSQIGPHIWFPEPMLAFHPNRTSDQSRHPLHGLLTYGPYSAGFVPDPIRVVTLAPAGESQCLYDFMKSLNSDFKPKERKDYLPEWPGFHGVFGLHMRGAGRGCHVETDPQLEVDLCNSSKPHIILADHLVRAVQRLDACRSNFDVLFVYIPQRWAAGFVGGSDDDFDLHDHLKAFAAARGIPIQLIREDSAITLSFQ